MAVTIRKPAYEDATTGYAREMNPLTDAMELPIVYLEDPTAGTPDLTTFVGRVPGSSPADGQLQSAAAGNIPFASLVTPAIHETLRQLIHFIDDGPADGFTTGAYKTTSYPSGKPFPSGYTWYVDNTLAKQIVSVAITRNANQTPSQEAWKMYAADGVTVVHTVTDTISYSGVVETSRTRAIT